MPSLSDVAEINPRFDRSQFESLDELATFVPMASVSEESGAITSEEHRPISDVLKGFTPFADRDVLVAKITPCFENGKIAHARISNRIGFGSTEFHVIRPFPERLDDRYLFHFLRQQRIRTEGERRMTGSAGQRRVPKAFLESLNIPAPSLVEQRRIAAILDRADALRAKRREAIAKLDQLLQSVFLDMFGDPRLNPRGFPVRKLSEFYISPDEGTRCGPFGSTLKKSDVEDSGVPLWNMDNISNAGQMQMPFRAHVSEDKARELSGYSVLNGDILISRAGTVGKMCVARTQVKKSLITTNLIRLRLGPGLVPEFFVALMTHCKGRVGRLKSGPDGAFTHMNTGILDSLAFPYPPIDEQQNWVKRSSAIHDQKAQLDRSLEAMTKTLESISASAFSDSTLI